MTPQATAHILIVEDNENDLYLASFILSREGLQVTEARDGEDGIRLAGELHPDLILTDLNMGSVDGYELIRTLKSSPHTSTIPIVAISVFVTPADRARAFEAGCQGFIEKPFIWDTLVVQVRSSLPASKEDKA